MLVNVLLYNFNFGLCELYGVHFTVMQIALAWLAIWRPFVLESIGSIEFDERPTFLLVYCVKQAHFNHISGGVIMTRSH